MLVPSWEPSYKERAAEGSNKCSNGDASIEYSFSCAIGEANIEDWLESCSLDLSEVDNAISEVERGKSDIPDDEWYFELGLIGHSSLD